jgi:lysophospholipase L1-like esterase
MFGGSTMWGTGARDAYTIPSILARELARKGVAAHVVNFGESGWVNTQELIALALELRQGRRPNLVIFYDGINDTYGAFQQGAAGIPQNEFNRVREFNFMEKPAKERLALVGRDIALRLSVRRLVGLFTADRRKGITRRLDEAAPGFRLDDAAAGRLASQVIEAYAANVEVIRALADHYGFKSLFYWQPTVADKRHLTKYEKECLAEMQPVDRFFRLTYAAYRSRQLDAAGPSRVRDLTKVFAETSQPMFVDRFHLGEDGNEVIVKHMLADVLAEISQAGDLAEAPAAAAGVRR